MTWQEYQEAVGQLYENMEGIGTVLKNITRPDKRTGQARQIDVWIQLESKSHDLGILVDAKFRKNKVDVKDVEEVLALAQAVGASKCALVALNGWTEPASRAAEFEGVDLRLMTLEDALDQIVPERWMICPVCTEDCIVADAGGMIVDGMWSLLTAGQCRSCQSAIVWCWACGENEFIALGTEYKCSCGHVWRNTQETVTIQMNGSDQWPRMSEAYGSIEEFFIDIPEPEEPTASDSDFYMQRGLACRDQGHR